MLDQYPNSVSTRGWRPDTMGGHNNILMILSQLGNAVAFVAQLQYHTLTADFLKSTVSPQQKYPLMSLFCILHVAVIFLGNTPACGRSITISGSAFSTQKLDKIRAAHEIFTMRGHHIHVHALPHLIVFHALGHQFRPMFA